MKKLLSFALFGCTTITMQAIPLIKTALFASLYIGGTYFANNSNLPAMHNAFKKDAKATVQAAATACNGISHIAGYYQITPAELLARKLKESELRYAFTKLQDATITVAKAGSESAATWLETCQQNINADQTALCASDVIKCVYERIKQRTETEN